MSEESASKQIDAIIEQYGGWKGDTIKRVRSIIMEADPTLVEEIKWRMATRPEGLPVWSSNGIVCFIETWNDNCKLLFSKGARLADPNKLFNSRLKSSEIRAIELKEGDQVDDAGLKALVLEAVELNANR